MIPLIRIRYYYQQPWYPWAVAAGLFLVTTLLMAVFEPPPPVANVAFIGNSVQYYNDFPRLMEAMSGNRIRQQKSCLHGNADLDIILKWGSGTYPIWYNASNHNVTAELAGIVPLPDLGECSVHQLLLGYDSKLEDEPQDYNETSANDYDPSKMLNDGKNPCFEMPQYLEFLSQDFFGTQQGIPPQWDFVVMNDNTRTPCCTDQRQTTLAALTETYVPLFLETGATPILLQTHPYWASWRDMSGLIDIPTFASYTYAGYRQYIDVLGSQLPANQQPRLAPVGLAHLLVWEENLPLWEELIHYDEVHPSPSGSFLQALIVHGTIFGQLPPAYSVLNTPSEYFFRKARRMVPSNHQLKMFPSQETASYLYYVAQRILQGELPKSLTLYEDYPSLDFIPDDSLYVDMHINH